MTSTWKDHLIVVERLVFEQSLVTVCWMFTIVSPSNGR